MKIYPIDNCPTWFLSDIEDLDTWFDQLNFFQGDERVSSGFRELKRIWSNLNATVLFKHKKLLPQPESLQIYPPNDNNMLIEATWFADHKGLICLELRDDEWFPPFFYRQKKGKITERHNVLHYNDSSKIKAKAVSQFSKFAEAY